jgi:hypothetical protein
MIVRVTHQSNAHDHGTDSRPRTALGSLSGGGVSERPKERASKAREGQPSAGSNPAATAS